MVVCPELWYTTEKWLYPYSYIKQGGLSFGEKHRLHRYGQYGHGYGPGLSARRPGQAGAALRLRPASGEAAGQREAHRLYGLLKPCKAGFLLRYLHPMLQTVSDRGRLKRNRPAAPRTGAFVRGRGLELRRIPAVFAAGNAFSVYYAQHAGHDRGGRPAF